MKVSGKSRNPLGGHEDEELVARDLIDFYCRWPRFRQVAIELLDSANLTPRQRETVRWLVELTDRVSERDIMP